MPSNNIYYIQEKNLTSPEFLVLVDEVFGEGFHRSKNFLANEYFEILAFYQNQLIGFCTGKIADAEFVSKLEIDNLVSGKIGVLDMMGVKKEFRNQKIGSKLFQLRQDKFYELHCEFGVQLHWIKNNSLVPSLAIKQGFELIKTIPNYWSKESLDQNYKCEVCGTPPCQCSCSVYLKKL